MTNPHENDGKYIVAIGASAGGLKAFKDFLRGIKADYGLTYILLQHLDPQHKSLLPELLQDSSSLPVIEISDELNLEKNKVYVLPSNAVAVLQKGVFNLMGRDSNNGSPHLVDDFFKNLAQQYGRRAIGVLLSGTGNDGTKGLKEIKDKHGITFAQQIDTAEWPGMPQFAINKGVVDFVLPPENMAEKMFKLETKIDKEDEHVDKKEYGDADVLTKVLQIIQREKDMDFSGYKKNTVFRRIKRRVFLSDKKDLPEYLEFFKNDKTEIDRLFNDLLIPVTEFFRDSATFDCLREQIFPKLIAGKGDDKTVRIWVAGGSTGQEAYSIGMCLLDYLKEVGDDNPYGEVYTKLEERIKIFSTDLSTQAILRARKGIYTTEEIKAVNKKHIKAYFTQDNDTYKVKKELRKICVFAEHDFLNDFPFGSMDMVSCRNVLIYLDPSLQEKALSNFHYALKEKGVLLLGNSETVSSVPELFNSIEKGHKIFRRSPGMRKTLAPVSKNKSGNIIKLNSNHGNNARESNKSLAEALLLEEYTPVAVVIDDNLDLISVHGKSGKYLEHTSGKASSNILKLAKGGLGFEIRQLVKSIDLKKDNKQVKENIKLKTQGKSLYVDLEVRLIEEANYPRYLVVFRDKQIEAEHLTDEEQSDEKDKRISSLENELFNLREEMLDIVEEHQVAEEELQSANEELMSGTEELQTLNEELETSKEELQSTVEEITVVNQELNNLNALLLQEKKFSESIVRTIRDPLLVLNKNLEVIMANKAFFENFKVQEAETLGRTVFTLGNGQWDIPKLRILLESILPSKQSFRDYEVTHDFESIGRRSLLLNGQVLKENDNQEESIFLSFEDVTKRKEARAKLKESIYTHHEFIRSSPWPILILKGEDLIIEILNSAMLKVLQKSDSIIGQPLAKAVPELQGTHAMHWLQEVYLTGVAYEAFQQPNSVPREDGKKEFYDVIYQPLRNIDGEVIGVSIISTVVTEQVILNEKVKKSEKQFRQLTNHLPELIVSYDVRDKSYYYNKSFLDFTGVSIETLSKEQWYSLIHPDDYERVIKEYRAAMISAENFEMELRIRNQEGNYIWCLNRNHCISDTIGNPIRWISTNTVIQRLKDEQKRKEDFLKLVSHELKTPVTSIKGYVQMLLSMISKDPNRSMSELPVESSLVRVENQVTRLTHLISEMLDLSRMEESKLDLNVEEFDLCKLVDDTIKDVQHSSGMVEIKTTYSSDCEVRADKERIGQVLINFITNAIKYSPDYKTIDVRVYRESSGQVSVSVKDYGIGLKKKDINRIFERFYRVSGKNEGTYSGFGIGLYLAKEIIDRHNGEIRVESKLGEGSNFIFSLPHHK